MFEGRVESVSGGEMFSLTSGDEMTRVVAVESLVVGVVSPGVVPTPVWAPADNPAAAMAHATTLLNTFKLIITTANDIGFCHLS